MGLAWRSAGVPGAATPAGTYLGLTAEDGSLLEGDLVALAGLEAPLRSAFDGQSHVVVWTAPGGAGLELDELRLARGGAPSTRRLADSLPAGLALGDLHAAPGELDLCSLEPDGSVQLRRFGARAAPPSTLSAPDRQAVGPCRLASSGRSALVAWRERPKGPRSASPDQGLAALSIDEPVARLVSAEAGPVAERPLALSALGGTMRIEAALWDGARYLVLLTAAGLRGGRLVLAIVDESGQLVEKDLLVPIQVEPGLLLAAALVAGSGADYTLLYGLRLPWDEGVLYLARFTLEARAADAR